MEEKLSVRINGELKGQLMTEAATVGLTLSELVINVLQNHTSKPKGLERSESGSIFDKAKEIAEKLTSERLEQVKQSAVQDYQRKIEQAQGKHDTIVRQLNERISQYETPELLNFFETVQGKIVDIMDGNKTRKIKLNNPSDLVKALVLNTITDTENDNE